MLLVLLPDSPRYTMVAATNARWRATHSSPETLGRGLFEVFPDNPEDPAATGTSNLRASLERVLKTRQPDTMPVQKVRHPRSGRYLPVALLEPEEPAGRVRERRGPLHPAPGRGRDRAGAGEPARRGAARPLQPDGARGRAAQPRAGRRGARPARRARQARRARRAKTAFFSNVSHEFRTPLTLMLGPARGRARRRRGAAAGRGNASAWRPLHRNALRLLKLVNALLDFSRIEAGRMEASFEPTDLAALTVDLASSFRSAIERAGLRLVVDCPPLARGRLRRPGDVGEDRLNLLSNAFKFTFEGGDRGLAPAAASQVDPRGARHRHRHRRRTSSRTSSSASTASSGARSRTPRGDRHRPLAGAGAGSPPRRRRSASRASSAAGQPLHRHHPSAGSAHLPADGAQAASGARLARRAPPRPSSRRRCDGCPRSGRPPSGRRPGAAAPAARTRPARAPRILVADDNADMRALRRAPARRQLGRARPSPTAPRRSTPRGADPPDLVLTDVMMPRPRRLRAPPRAPRRRADAGGSPSSCSRPARARRRPSRGCGRARTTTSSSRSPRASCSRGCAPTSISPSSAAASSASSNGGSRRAPPRSGASPGCCRCCRASTPPWCASATATKSSPRPAVSRTAPAVTPWRWWR